MKILLLNIALFWSLLSYSATIADTLYLNFDTTSVVGYSVYRAAFNDTSEFNPRNSIIELEDGDILELTIYNSDSIEHSVEIAQTQFLGSIAAGTPIEAIQHEVDKVALPEDLQKNGEYFGLKVKGDSMIEAGINNGDTVIIKKTSTADTGQIAVVLIDEQEATLKRIRKKGNTIALEAANKNYDTKIYASNRIKIQGRLISLYRNFH